MVPVAGHGLAPLSRSIGTLTVGDRCFVLDSAGEGDRVITEAGVVGQEASPGARLRLSSGFAAGSPVLDDHGDLLGIVAGPGAAEGPGPAGSLYNFADPIRMTLGSLMLPADRLPAAPTARTNLAELAARGEFLAPLSPDQRLVISGVVAARVERVGAVMMPQDQRYVFAHQDGEMSVFIQWNPQAKKDAMSRLEIYDTDRRLIGKGAPAKLKLRPGEFAYGSWTVGVGRLPAGMYRLDVVLDDSPVWRAYVRITD